MPPSTGLRESLWRGGLLALRDVFAPDACPDAPAEREVLVHVRECDQGPVDSPRPFYSAHGQVPWRFYDRVLADWFGLDKNRFSKFRSDSLERLLRS